MAWVLSKGTYGDGSEIIDLFRTKQGANDAFNKLAIESVMPITEANMRALSVRAWDNDNMDELSMNDGTDYIELRWYEVKP